MAKKLYGAAKKAHDKRLAKLRRKRKAKKSTTSRKRTTASKKRVSPKRRAAGLKGARTRKRRAAARKRTQTTTRRRARRNPPAKVARRRRRGQRGTTMRRRATTRRRSPTRRRRARRNPPRGTYGVKALSRARKSIKRAKRAGGYANWYRKRHRMATNPATFMGAVKAAVPIAGSLYLSRFLTNWAGPKIPGIDKLQVGGYNLARPVLGGGLWFLTHFATKRVKGGFIKKNRGSILLGMALNFVDSVVSTFAPSDVKAMFGMGADSGLYDGVGDYVAINDYVSIGNAPPIDDDIALADYVSIGQVEEELGALEQELGMLEADLGAEEDLGSTRGYDDRGLGGVHQRSMLAPIQPQAMVAPIPARSWTKPVPRAGAGYDRDSILYQGVFRGGF